MQIIRLLVKIKKAQACRHRTAILVIGAIGISLPEATEQEVRREIGKGKVLGPHDVILRGKQVGGTLHKGHLEITHIRVEGR